MTKEVLIAHISLLMLEDSFFHVLLVLGLAWQVYFQLGLAKAIEMKSVILPTQD